MESTFNDTDVGCIAKTKTSPGEKLNDICWTIRQSIVYNALLFE